MAACIKCKKSDSASKPAHVACDHCRIIQCVECSGLSVTEARAVLLKNRVIKFFCQKCSTSQIDQLAAVVADASSGLIGSDLKDLLPALLGDVVRPLCDRMLSLELEIKNLRESNARFIDVITKTPELINKINPAQRSDKNKTDKALVDNNVHLSRGKLKVTTHNESSAASERVGDVGMSSGGEADVQFAVAGDILQPSTSIERRKTQDDESGSGDFTTVTYRKNRQRRHVTLGTAERSARDSDDCVFVGRETSGRKAWLFVSRVGDGVTEVAVRDYIRKKIDVVDDGDVVVREIATGYTRKDSKCFQVGVKIEFKDKLYDSEFWPSGVAFRRFRFNFSKGGNFQKDASKTSTAI